MRNLIREADLTFGTNGNGIACLLDGWVISETDYTWSVGKFSHIKVPLIARAMTSVMLELDVSPFLCPPKLPSQRLKVSIEGKCYADLELDHATVIGVPIPASCISNRDNLFVRLDHPQSAAPSELNYNADKRQLGFALSGLRVLGVDHLLSARSGLAAPIGTSASSFGAEVTKVAGVASGLSLADLAVEFEGLGHNCEFGLVQRRCGAEPLGLLRFAGIQPARLVYGLEVGFAGVGAPQNIEPIALGNGDRREWIIREHLYGLMYHTFIAERNSGPDFDHLLRKQVQKLQFEQRKLLEDLLDPRKIFVYQSGNIMSPYEALPVWLRLRAFGNATLLFITSGVAAEAGTVVRLADGLFQGFISRLAPINEAGDLKFSEWVSILENAVVLRGMTSSL